MKIYFLTFGAPTKNYHEAVERLCNQAKQMNIFNEIIGITEKDLQNDNEFWSKHCNFINNNKRGYGYWLWKPYIIKKKLEKMDNDDILLYLDCGCELNYLAHNKFLEYIELVKTKKILGTKASSTDHNYTKMDLIKYFGMENNIELLKVKHMQAGALLILKCEKIINLFNEFYEIGSSNYHYIDDSSSIEQNFKDFKEHRHDQSIFNLLVKKNNLINYCLEPNTYNEYPILPIRNKTGESVLFKS